MDTTVSVGNIPNGTSPMVMRGTAIHLVKKLLTSAKPGEGGQMVYDYLWVGQLAGCLGITQGEALRILEMISQGQTPEAVIDDFVTERIKLKEETINLMKDKLANLK